MAEERGLVVRGTLASSCTLATLERSPPCGRCWTLVAEGFRLSPLLVAEDLLEVGE